MPTVQVIGVPQDLGANRRGVDMGPSAIRYAGLTKRLKRLGYAVTDRGNVPVKLHEEKGPGNELLRYLDEIVTTNELLAQEVTAVMEAGDLPLVLGGDHSIAIGTLAGVAAVKNCGVIWLDAHGDFNTLETTTAVISTGCAWLRPWAGAKSGWFRVVALPQGQRRTWL